MHNLKETKNINIGSVIKRKVKETMSVTRFAKQINLPRSSVYLLFENKSIDIELLSKISKVLNYNFIKEYLQDSQSDNK
jgi:predicted transcriptional regulator